jgi:ParB-like chromosome segregation protein Spo0J
VNYVDEKRGYVFLKSLTQRRRELEKEVRDFGVVIWPLVVRKEDLELVDGYCRYATLKAMNVKRVYVYAGSV